jgi:hypothetical protein
MIYNESTVAVSNVTDEYKDVASLSFPYVILG